MLGKRFNRLIVKEKITGGWRCICDCGAEKEAKTYQLTAGLVGSCGCYRREFRKTHGRNTDPIYKVWNQMRQRCNNPKAFAYNRYGGRGITVCKRWQKFENFIADMGERPTPVHTIDRIENDKGYSPSNCRWATRHEQAQNTCYNRNVTWRGKTKSLSAWALETGINVKTLQYRVDQNWPLEKIFSKKNFARQKRT